MRHLHVDLSSSFFKVVTDVGSGVIMPKKPLSSYFQCVHFAKRRCYDLGLDPSSVSFGSIIQSVLDEIEETESDIGIWKTIDSEIWFSPSAASREKAWRKQEVMRSVRQLAIEQAKARIVRIQKRDKRPPAGLVNFTRQRF